MTDKTPPEPTDIDPEKLTADERKAFGIYSKAEVKALREANWVVIAKAPKE